MAENLQTAVIGAGLMGHGIALTLARAGQPVAITDPLAEARASVAGRIVDSLRLLGDNEALISDTLARIEICDSIGGAVGNAAFVFEAAPEKLPLKQSIFAEIEARAPVHAILASNTSVMPITDIMSGLRNKARALGTHWWNPPHLIPLVEVTVVSALGLHPLLAMAIVVPAMASVGYVLQRVILNRTMGDDILPPLLVTFGLSIIIQNALLTGYSADPQKLQAGALETASVSAGGLTVGVLPVIVFTTAVVIIGGLQWMFYHTALGRAFRATSDRQDVAQLMGLNRGHVFAMAMALSLAVTAVAGIFLGIRTSFDPAIGGSRLIFGFEAVIIGGLGNMWGTLAGGIILGIAQAVGGQIHPSMQLLAGHVVFLIILAVRPRGLFPKMEG